MRTLLAVGGRAVGARAYRTLPIAVLFLAGALCAIHPGRVEVTGDSMRPALLAGDRLLVVRPWRLRPGDVVAVRDPRRPSRLMVKRVESNDGDQVIVVGDDSGASTDSRHFGPVPRPLVRGRAVYRYAPPDRVGAVPAR